MSAPGTEPPGPVAGPQHNGAGPTRRRFRGGVHRELSLVPDAEFGSYYGRPVLKTPV
jgi:hypothetical protein